MPHVIVMDTEALVTSRAADDWSRAIEDGRRVLGLATGQSVVAFYREWADRMREWPGKHTLETFNLDEYYGIGRSHPGTFRQFMDVQCFQLLGLDAGQVHFLPADPVPQVDVVCQAYEEELERAGGLDLCLLGIGGNGHLGFNEPGTALESRTHLAALTDETRAANQGSYPGGVVPERALTMGLRTIAEARRLVLLAFGAGKAEAVRRALTGPVDPRIPASLLLDHPDAWIYLDREAAGRL